MESTSDAGKEWAAAPALFEADLLPHRSLSRAGFVAMMAALCAVSFVAGLVFFVVGAWPVIGFLGLDVALIFFAFRANYVHGHLTEHVRLDRDALLIERRWPAGRIQRWRFEPYWTRIELLGTQEEPGRLDVRCRDERLSLGGFLSPGERASFYRAFAGALRGAKGG